MSHQVLKILLIEDNENDYIIVRDMLAMVQAPHFEVTWVSTYEAAIAKLADDHHSSPEFSCRYDACLLDYHLGGHNGLEVLQYAIAHGYSRPIILLTGAGSRHIDLKALEIGASGFLAKAEISPGNLERCIRYAIRQKQTEILLHQSQAALAQTNATLASQVAEQLIELDHTRERLAYLGQLQSQLLASVSHEFRTPLMHIQGSAELLEEFPSDAATQSRRFQMIHEGVNRITKTLDNALVYSALESGTILFKPAPLHLIGVCESILAALKPIANQQFKFTHPSEFDLPVLIDVSLVQVILTHLLLNAIRYAPQSDVIQLTVAYQDAASGPGQIIFQVTDQGIGIPVDEQHNVFDAYFRASNADSIPGTPGIGLGLAIVRRAAAIHGGTVHLTSQVGVGTTITLTLPFIPTT